MKELKWETHVKFFKNPVILKELGISIGIPFGTLIIIIILLAKGNIMGTDAKYALFLILILFILTVIIIMVIYKGKYAPGFIINEKGITNYTQEHQANKNKFINGVLFIFGILRFNLSAAGSGVLAQGKQIEKIKWKEIRQVKYYPKDYTIIVKGAFTQKIAIFCTKDNYNLVEATIKDKTYSL